MPLENILVPCMPLAPHVIDTKKYTYMPLSGTQGMSIKSDGIPGIFPYLLQQTIWPLLPSVLKKVVVDKI
jgi:hypothetical protein